MPIVSFAVVIRIIMQCFSPVSGVESCMMTLITAAKETTCCTASLSLDSSYEKLCCIYELNIDVLSLSFKHTLNTFLPWTLPQPGNTYIPTNQFKFTILLTSVDLQLKPYRSDDYIPQLCYESSRFSALGQQWVVKANVVGNEKTVKRILTYQLVQKGKTNLNIKFLMLQSPFSDLTIKPEVHQQQFTCDVQESGYHDLVLSDPQECNKMLEANSIKLRMIIFQIPGSDWVSSYEMCIEII